MLRKSNVPKHGLAFQCEQPVNQFVCVILLSSFNDNDANICTYLITIKKKYTKYS